MSVCPSDRGTEQHDWCLAWMAIRAGAEGVKELVEACALPVTVKHRIGINVTTAMPQLLHFVGQVMRQAVKPLSCMLGSPSRRPLAKENRDIPPLRYDVVHQLKSDFPQLEIIINGGPD